MRKECNHVCECVGVKEILYKTHNVSKEMVSDCRREGDEGPEYDSA